MRTNQWQRKSAMHQLHQEASASSSTHCLYCRQLILASFKWCFHSLLLSAHSSQCCCQRCHFCCSLYRNVADDTATVVVLAVSSVDYCLLKYINRLLLQSMAQLLLLSPSPLCYLLAANTNTVTDCYCPCCWLIVISFSVSAIDLRVLFWSRLAYAAATGLAITACAAPCTTVFPAPQYFQHHWYYRWLYPCHLSLCRVPFDCCFSLLSFLIVASFAMVVFAASLHCGPMP